MSRLLICEGLVGYALVADPPSWFVYTDQDRAEVEGYSWEEHETDKGMVARWLSAPRAALGAVSLFDLILWAIGDGVEVEDFHAWRDEVLPLSDTVPARWSTRHLASALMEILPIAEADDEARVSVVEADESTGPLHGRTTGQNYAGAVLIVERGPVTLFVASTALTADTEVHPCPIEWGAEPVEGGAA